MKLRTVVPVVLFMAITGCGGGGGGGSSLDSGVFIDSAVEGLRYETSSNRSGMTDAAGTFSYASGDTVEFFVGDISLGSATGKAVITPIDLVPGGNITHPTVTNILRFVQSLDDDDNPANGIRITTAISNLAANRSIDFDQSITDFEDDGNVQTIVSELTSARTAGARLLVDAAIAQSHLATSLGSGGNGGGTPGAFGTLAVSGNDTGTIGTTFEPSISTPVISGVPPALTGVVWSAMKGIGTTNVQASTLTITLQGTTPVSIIMVHGFSDATAYSHMKLCFLNEEDCSGVTVDLENRTVTFEQTGVPVTPGGGNIATAPVILDGTLSWE